MAKLILVDGSSIINACFFATVPREYFIAKSPEERKFILPRIMKTRTGIFTNGVFAMMKSLKRLIKNQQPSHLAIAWDVSRETFRRAMYPDYKANRSETAPELKSQFILMQEILAAAGIAQFMDQYYEADDFIGSLAHQFEEQIPVYIWTKDQDALQLVTDRTRLWLITNHAAELRKKYNHKDAAYPEGSFEFTPMLVKEVYGLYPPNQIIDKKALEGDVSDNIPGVARVGEKTAIPLLQEFGSVEAIYEALEDEKGFKEMCKELGIRSPLNALKNDREMAFLSKDLATIRCMQLDCKIDDLQLNIKWSALNEKLRELEFHSLIEPNDLKPHSIEDFQGCLVL